MSITQNRIKEIQEIKGRAFDYKNRHDINELLNRVDYDFAKLENKIIYIVDIFNGYETYNPKTEKVVKR
jgi:thermostable 8-oxoguanine DNA glycosylase|tara:strand:- start:71 stop:277 length:207 start_codon:yes stop_codon:yes gene_type:complete